MNLLKMDEELVAQIEALIETQRKQLRTEFGEGTPEYLSCAFDWATDWLGELLGLLRLSAASQRELQNLTRAAVDETQRARAAVDEAQRARVVDPGQQKVLVSPSPSPTSDADDAHEASKHELKQLVKAVHKELRAARSRTSKMNKQIELERQLAQETALNEQLRRAHALTTKPQKEVDADWSKDQRHPSSGDSSLWQYVNGSLWGLTGIVSQTLLDKQLSTLDKSFPSLHKRCASLEKSFPSPDKIFPTPDKSFPTPDKIFPSPDKSFLTPDKSFPTPKKSFPSPDKSVPTPDKSFPTPGKSFPSPDKSFPSPDKCFQSPDKPFPSPDFPTPPERRMLPSPSFVNAGGDVLPCAEYKSRGRATRRDHVTPRVGTHLPATL